MHATVSRWLKRAAAGGAVLAVTGSGLYASAANGDADWDLGWSDRTDEIADLIEAYRVTAPFHDVDNALEAGWAEDSNCIDYPDGYLGEPPGTMGHHFYNEEYLTDGGRIDPGEPELVLYEKRADGSWRLNAVEYVIPAADRPPTAPAPELFGREFRFHPDVGANGIWGMHVWLWRPNPHGLYAELNPLVTCEHAEAGHAH